MEAETERIAALERRVSDESGRVNLLEHRIKQNEKDLEHQGGALENLLDTVNTIVVPTQEAHTQDIIECKQRTQASHDYITMQKGAWAWIQRVIVVIGGASAAATLVMKVLGK